MFQHVSRTISHVCCVCWLQYTRVNQNHSYIQGYVVDAVVVCDCGEVVVVVAVAVVCVCGSRPCHTV